MVYYRNVYGCKPSDYNDGFLSIFCNGLHKGNRGLENGCNGYATMLTA